MKPAVHQYEDKLLEFAYGELSAPEASAVEAHVTGCPRCTQTLTEIRTVRTTMGQLPQVAAPDAGLDSLFAYAEQAARRNAAGPEGAPSFWKRLITPLAGAMALGLIAVVGVKVSKDEAPLMAPPAAVAVKADESRRPAPLEAHADAVAAAPEVPAPQPAADGLGQLEKAPGGAREQQKLDDAFAGAGEAKPALKGGLAPSKKKAPAFKDSEAEAYDRPITETKIARGGGAYVQGYGATPAPEEAQRQEKKTDLGVMVDKAARVSQTRRAEGGKDELAAADAKQQAEPRQQAPSLGYTNAGASLKPAAEPAAAPPAVAQAPAPSKPAGKGSSYGLGAGSSGDSFGNEADSVGSSAGPRSKNSIPAAPPKTVAMENARSRDDSPAKEERKAPSAKDIAALLSSARGAHAHNDLTQEIAYAAQAIAAGAQGSQRGEALQRMCEAYDSLGQEASADQACNTFMAEFGNTAAAQRIAQRRNAPSMNPAPAAAVKRKASEKKAADQSLENADQQKATPAAAY